MKKKKLKQRYLESIKERDEKHASARNCWEEERQVLRWALRGYATGQAFSNSLAVDVLEATRRKSFLEIMEPTLMEPVFGPGGINEVKPAKALSLKEQFPEAFRETNPWASVLGRGGEPW